MKEAYHLWSGRIHTQKTILRELEAKYRRTAVSSRTISRWIKEFNSVSFRESEQDNKYEWRSLSKYEIPWQDGKLANYLNSEYRHQTASALPNFSTIPRSDIPTHHGNAGRKAFRHELWLPSGPSVEGDQEGRRAGYRLLSEHLQEL